MTEPIGQAILSYGIAGPPRSCMATWPPSFRAHVLHMAAGLEELDAAEVLDIVVAEELDEDDLEWVSRVAYRP